MSVGVLHIVPSLQCTGMLRQLTWICQDLASVGCRVGVASLAGEDAMARPLREAGAQLPTIRPSVGRPAGWLLDLDAAVTGFRPDIVHTWTASANRWGRLVARRHRVPRVLASFRTLDCPASVGDRYVERWLAKGTSVGVANSELAAQHWANAGVPTEKIRVIPNAAVAGVERSDEARHRLRDELGLPQETRLVGAFGPLVTGKRLQDLLWAIDLLHAIREDTYLLVVGDGPQRWRLERFARQMHAAERTRFLGWRADAPALLAGLDCLWLGSARESQPNSVLEAMAAGVPVVAADSPATRLLIDPDRSGLLVAPGHRGGIARATQQILESPEVAVRLAAAAREHVQRHHGLPTMLARYRELYQLG